MKPLYTEKQMNDFLRESNAIEGVYDTGSLFQAKEAMDYLLRQKMLTTPVVLHTHKILMLNQNLQPDQKGYLRNCPVYIGGKEALNSILVRPYLALWCKKSNRAGADAKALHVEYEGIHPFVDGNGRTGRMFMNWTRLKNNEPLLIIKASERGEYYQWFK